MKGMELPEGRSAKACRHVLDKFKSTYYKKDGTNGDAGRTADMSDDGASPARSSMKPTAKQRKRKAEGDGKAAKKAKAQINESAEDGDHTL
jgi:hypothetical protein